MLCVVGELKYSYDLRSNGGLGEGGEYLTKIREKRPKIGGFENFVDDNVTPHTNHQQIRHYMDRTEEEERCSVSSNQSNAFYNSRCSLNTSDYYDLLWTSLYEVSTAPPHCGLQLAFQQLPGPQSGHIWRGGENV